MNAAPSCCAELETFSPPQLTRKEGRGTTLVLYSVVLSRGISKYAS
jgi:hypothetical protein